MNLASAALQVPADAAPGGEPHTSDDWAAAGRRDLADSDRPTAWGPLAGVTLLLSAFCAVIVFLPDDGRISRPLHDGVQGLLGGASFMLPLGLACGGVLLLVRHLRPAIRFPRRRLAGIGLLALGVLPIEHLLGGSERGTGLLGQWLSSSLIDLLGAAGAGLVLLVVLAAGVLLAFDVKRPASPTVESAQPDAAH